MTSPSEVIALEGAGDRRGADNSRFRTNFKPKKQFKHYPYFVDPAIVPRVKQYLEDNKDKVYIDIEEMVTELQRKYRDYGKRKRSVFKGLVEKAFSVVLKTYNMHDTSRDEDEADSSSVSDMDIDSEDVDLIVEPNTSNNQVMNMYMQQQAMKKITGVKQGAGNEGAKELIDISSDDDDEEQAPAKRTKHTETVDGVEQIQSTCPVIQPHKAANGQATPAEVAVAHENSSNNVPAADSVSVKPTPAVLERPKRKRPVVEGGNGPVSGPSSSDITKKRRREVPVLQPSYSFKDIGGCSGVLQEVCKLLVHLRHPEIFEQIGVTPPRGFLLHGPPGCGKTLLASAIAGELGVPLLKVAAPELVAGVSGESEERIRDLFDQAVSLAPCVLFLDEIDAITPNRNNAQREMERRIVAQLLTTLDELGEKEGGNQVLVVGATNRPDSLDPALRRAGRFDREVCMGIPDKEARAHILRVVCSRLALAPEVSSDAGIDELASLTPGFVGADLSALTREAAMVAVNRLFAQIQENSESAKEKLPDQTEEPSCVNSDSPAVNGGNESTISQSQVVSESNNIAEEIVSTIDKSIVTADQEQVETNERSQNQTSEETQIIVETPKTEDEAQTTIESNLTETRAEDLVKGKEDEQMIVDSFEKEQIENSSKPDSEIDDQGINTVANVTCSTDLPEEIQVVLQENGNRNVQETEPQESINSKADDDVEVLEVQAMHKEEEDNSSCCPEQVESTSSKVVQNDMTLTQKLLPVSAWSPELCQLMTWLKETPPLSTSQLSELTISMSDFHEALRHVQPSAKREGFATVPDVTWDDVGSLAHVRTELQMCVLAPVRYAKQFSELGLNAPAGVLLCGPPGCGKTLLAKAVANEAGINFISVKGPELLNMYVGESERAVRQVFQRARNSAPCVIFFDELDALCPKRSDYGDSGVSSRVVNQLLTEMDGIEGRKAVFLMAASNRPDIIDPAVLRPGRLDKIVYVGLPNADDRKDILRALTKNGTRPQLSSDVNLGEIASRSTLEGYSGADLAALVREAGVQALRDFIGTTDQTGPLSVALKHFDSAASKIRPSVTGKARVHYEKLQAMYSKSLVVSDKPETMDTAS
ncbi:Nuclear valosin-containing protein-like [Frankliniella fusca]|uniref:Nuclear valosin-containing protein-like n=1 Tax=Frankliniella fusca TaxID=407009 RepID=A0AAE1I2X9_9NEOP|nr:Nuclear valosin-containing protein-like [Frankliniella fusca]